MVEFDAKTSCLAIATVVVWAVVGAVVWFGIDANVVLVGGKTHGHQPTEAALLAQADLAPEKAMLEKTRVWLMERDGLPPAVKAATDTVEKKIVWSIAATVVRPKEHYLLVQDQETKLITQVNIGDLLPDGSKLLQVAMGFYTVRAKDGKRRTVDTSL